MICRDNPEAASRIQKCEQIAQEMIALAAEALLLEWNGQTVQANTPDSSKQYILTAIEEEVTQISLFKKYSLDLAEIALFAVTQQDTICYESAIQTMTQDLDTVKDKYKIVRALYEQLLEPVVRRQFGIGSKPARSSLTN